MAAGIIIRCIRGEAVGAGWPCDSCATDGGSRIRFFYLSSGSLRQPNVTLTGRAAGDSTVILASGLQGGRGGRGMDGVAGLLPVPAPLHSPTLHPCHL